MNHPASIRAVQFSAYVRALITTLWPPLSVPDGSLRPVEISLSGDVLSAAHPEDRSAGLARHHLILRGAVLQRLGLSFLLQGHLCLSRQGQAVWLSLAEYDRQPETAATSTDLMTRLSAEAALTPLWSELRGLEDQDGSVRVLSASAELGERACSMLARRHSLGQGRHTVVYTTQPPAYTVHRDVAAASAPLPLRQSLISHPRLAALSSNDYLAGGEALQRQATRHYLQEAHTTPDLLMRELAEWSGVPSDLPASRTLLLPVRV